MKIAVVLDLEGVLLPPGVDFAFMTVEAACHSYTELKKTLIKMLETFDMFDDNRWMYYKFLKGSTKYQTGTTPFYSLMMLAMLGKNDDEAIAICEKILDALPLNEVSEIAEGVRQLAHKLIIASSAYYQFVKKTLEKASIKFDEIYALGNTIIDNIKEERILSKLCQLFTREKLCKLCDLVYHFSEYCIKREKYKVFNSLLNCAKLSEEQINYIKMFLIEQRGIAGSSLKASVVRKLREEGYFTIFVGDSIVDAEAAEVANVSISINTSSHHLLNVSTFNVITRDYRVIVDIIRLIIEGRPWAIKEELHDKCEVLSRVEISENLNRVLEINRKVRTSIVHNIRNMFMQKVLQTSSST